MSAAIPGGRSAQPQAFDAIDTIATFMEQTAHDAIMPSTAWFHEAAQCLREARADLSALLTAAGSAPVTTHGHHFSDTTWAGQAQLPKRCPRCDSPSPELHPSVQWEGEVQPCSDPWHSQPTNRTPVAAPVTHTPDLNIAWQNIDRALVHLPDDQLCGVWPDGSGLRGTHIKHLIAELRGAAVPAQAPPPDRIIELAREKAESIHLRYMGYYSEMNRAGHSGWFVHCPHPDCNYFAARPSLPVQE